MFGDFNLVNENALVEMVDYRVQDETRYTSSNNEQKVIIDTPLARVYINEDSYFTVVPESAWYAKFEGELSPEEFLKKIIGSKLTDQDIKGFQNLLDDLINAEFNSKIVAEGS